MNPAGRRATRKDIATDAIARMLRSDCAWRYLTGLQVENLLTFDLARYLGAN